jgi:hypothetical protein
MPKIPQQYLDCSIYLYRSRESAEEGENFGGSGCLVYVQDSPYIMMDNYHSFMNGIYSKTSVVYPAHIYAVTNKHVARGGFPVIRLNTIDDKIDVIELNHHDWIPHPEGEDLAVAPIDLPEDKHNFYAISTHMFVGRESLNSHLLYPSIGAGDDTFMVGRFVTHAGKQRNTPSLRFGSIAMLPFEKVKLDSGHMQEAFLVETRSLSGYSGSPVFVYRPVQETTHIPTRNLMSDIYSTSITDLVGQPILLGIDCGHARQYKKVENGAGIPHPQGWRTETNTGMAIVIPAWQLKDWLEKPEFVRQRKQKDEQWLKGKEAEEQSGSVAFDIEKLKDFSAEDYHEALKRASRKIEPEKEQKQ